MANKTLSMTQQSIKSYIETEKKRIGNTLNSDEVFEYIAAQQILKSYLINDEDTERGIIGGGNDGGYDGIFVFLNEVLITGEDLCNLNIQKTSHVEIHFIQAKNQRGLSESIFEKWNSSFPNLLSSENPDRERYSDEVCTAFSLIRDILAQSISLKLNVSLHFWSVTLAESVHPNVLKAQIECEQAIKQIVPSTAYVDFSLVTSKRLFDMIITSPDKTATLEGTKDPLCPDSSSAIMTVSLNEYNRFISAPEGGLNKTFFEANIRDYQGRTAVNKAIEETLVNETETDFWWLNNGVTIVADSIERNMGSSITLKNPRVVNGLQTSNVINKYCESHDTKSDNRKVLVKCIATDNQNVRAGIITATNKQANIPSVYLRALDPVQVKIERYFQEHGLHYDRRKTSCKNNGIKPEDIISIQFLGQCLISLILLQPDYARARPSQIISDQSKYEKLFNESIPLDSYLKLGRLAIDVRKWLKQSKYSRGVQNDILFHLLLSVCAKQLETFEITAKSLATLSLWNSTEYEATAKQVYEIYVQLGGNGSVAKSKIFTKKLRERLETASCGPETATEEKSINQTR